MKILLSILLMFSLFLSASCSLFPKDDEDDSPFKGVPAEELYADAKKSLGREEYESAIKRFEALETLYPFHDHAEEAQIDLIYAYYQKGDYPSSAATAERFIHLYPRAKRVDYVYYMKGLANFQQTRGTLNALLPIDESWRDPGTQTQAYTDFSTLVQLFPESKYKKNALQRMIYLRNMFAKHELNVAEYYFGRKMYVATIERAQYLLKNYSQAPSAEPALALVVKSNRALGLVKAAEDAERVYMASYHHPVR